VQPSLLQVREVDNRQIGAGKAGPVTLALQAAFFDVVKGKNKKYKQWLTYL
jgi:branched-chain amino acid aminotransferase